MNGYGSHAFTWVNAMGEAFYVKYHLKPSRAPLHRDSDGKAQAADDPDFRMRDLCESIADGQEATWRLEMQIMPVDEAEDYRFNPVRPDQGVAPWRPPAGDDRAHGAQPQPREPLRRGGAGRVRAGQHGPGIEPSPDKMLLGRLFSYPDTHRHRIGPNFLQLSINQPRVPVNSYNKDGAIRYRHSADQPVTRRTAMAAQRPTRSATASPAMPPSATPAPASTA
jgi:catalase